MGTFDQFANQGGPSAESADALAEAVKVTDEQLANADYAGDLPEPLGNGRHVSAELTEENRAAEAEAASSAESQDASSDFSSGASSLDEPSHD